MAKTLEEGFAALLARLIPLNSENEKARSHKQSVKSCLENNFSCYNFFETGSFGNGTGVRHYSDTDYFAVCPVDKFYSSSDYSLRKVKEALKTKFWSTEGIEVRRPAVKIPFGTLKSENLEVTPCTYSGMVDTPVGNLPVYYIADFNDGWMKSSPQAHIKYVNRENERLRGKLKPLIQLVKAWKFYNSVPITSFYLELRVTKYAEKESVIVYDIDLRHIFKLLSDNELASIIDPMGISGYVPACSTSAKKEEAISKIKTAFSRAENALSQKDKNIDDCFYWWNLLFNGRFPTR